jgi:undecaprenyl-diphosphatase
MKRVASHRGLIGAAHNRQFVHPSFVIAAAADHGNHAAHLSWFQAVVLGAVQGVTELFPISSLGHTVLLPTLFGWTQLVKDQSDPESYWLALVVMLHVGSALGLLAYFWRDWLAIIRAFFVSLWRRRIDTPTEKLAWLIVAASIPVGVIGIVLEHPLRVLFAKPTAAAIFLMVNGVILLGAERLRRRAPARAALVPTAHAYAGANPDPERGWVRQSVSGSGGAAPFAPELVAGDAPAADESAELSQITFRNAVGIGFAQSTALIAGISRDGVCMSAGLLSGLDNETAARFAFLLATPIILAAGIFKLSDLTGPLGNGIRPQAAVACGCAAITAVVAVHYLLRYFQTRTLVPFGLYCLGFGLAMTIYTVV